MRVRWKVCDQALPVTISYSDYSGHGPWMATSSAPIDGWVPGFVDFGGGGTRSTDTERFVRCRKSVTENEVGQGKRNAARVGLDIRPTYLSILGRRKEQCQAKS